MALLPPPTQATTLVGQPAVAFAASARAASRPITDWKSRTIVGNGCGPTTEPMM